MIGMQSIEIRNNTCVFKLNLERNISIIRGMSATGKTTLVNMIQSYDEYGPSSGITLRAQKRCVVLGTRNWEILLEQIHDSIVFIDEGQSFISSADFARAVRDSDNYYVIISRKYLFNLPIGVEAIYGLRGRKYYQFEKTYHTLYRMYPDQPELQVIPKRILTEDSNAGFQFFQSISKKLGILCETTGGNANLLNYLRELDNQPSLLIADGAAFGAYIEMALDYQKSKNIYIYLPESFEWMILSSGLIKDGEIQDILKNPSSHIESRDYFSWERFFTAKLIEKTNGTWLQYSKGTLNPVYNQTHEVQEILKNTPLRKLIPKYGYEPV